jgi:hypothetical protein
MKQTIAEIVIAPLGSDSGTSMAAGMGMVISSYRRRRLRFWRSALVILSSMVFLSSTFVYVRVYAL